MSPGAPRKNCSGRFTRSNSTHLNDPMRIDVQTPFGILNALGSEKHKFGEKR